MSNSFFVFSSKPNPSLPITTPDLITVFAPIIQFEIDEFDEIKTFSEMKTFGPMVQFDSIITLFLIIEFS